MSAVVDKNTFDLALAELDRTQWNSGYSFALWTNDVTPNQNMSPSDFTEADYDGYARLAASFGPLFVDQAAELTFVAQGQFISTPGLGTTNVVKGILMQDNGGNPIVAAKLDTVVSMGALGQALYFVLEIRNGVGNLVVLP